MAQTTPAMQGCNLLNKPVASLGAGGVRELEPVFPSCLLWLCVVLGGSAERHRAGNI